MLQLPFPLHVCKKNWSKGDPFQRIMKAPFGLLFIRESADLDASVSAWNSITVHNTSFEELYTDGQSLRTFFFQNFHSPHLGPSKNLHTKNLLASKVLTVRPFRCTRFLLWEPRQPTVRYALTIFFSQHNLLSFQFSRSVSAMLVSSNRHWLKTKCSVWDWTFWKNQRVRECPNVNSTHADTHRHTKKNICLYIHMKKKIHVDC